MDARKTIGELVSACRGHFVFESGHHGDLWLDLELLCLRPGVVRPFAAELAKRLSTRNVDTVCGPLVEGAFVALLVAEELGVEFVYAERIEHPERGGLFPVEYRLPAVLREKVRGKRVAIVNDVINAGSAVQGAAADLKACGAELAGIACLMTLGDAAAEIAAQYGVPLYTLATQEIGLWTPEECPLCRTGVPLAREAAARLTSASSVESSSPKSREGAVAIRCNSRHSGSHASVAISFLARCSLPRWSGCVGSTGRLRGRGSCCCRWRFWSPLLAAGELLAMFRKRGHEPLAWVVYSGTLVDGARGSVPGFGRAGGVESRSAAIGWLLIGLGGELVAGDPSANCSATTAPAGRRSTCRLPSSRSCTSAGSIGFLVQLRLIGGGDGRPGHARARVADCDREDERHRPVHGGSTVRPAQARAAGQPGQDLGRRVRRCCVRVLCGVGL